MTIAERVGSSPDLVDAPIAPEVPQIPYDELRPDLYPADDGPVRDRLLYTTQMIALVAKAQIEYMQPEPLLIDLPKPEKKSRVLSLDNTSADITEILLGGLPCRGFMKIFEGKKEKQDHKGGLDIKTLGGMQGDGDEQTDLGQDPIEGSDGAAHNRKGTISSLASGTRGGILEAPKGIIKEEIHYMEKLFAQPNLKGIVSLEKSPEENLRAAAEHLSVDPADFEITVLNRDRNKKLIEAIEDFGGKVNLIEFGDLVPALKAMTDDQKDGIIRMVMGIGGWEEGILAAIAAKALGAVAQGRMAEVWEDENKKEQHVVYPQLLEIDDLAPTLKEHAAVFFTAITDIPEFDMKGVDLKNGYAQCMVIDKDGFHKQGFLFNPDEAKRFAKPHVDALKAA